MKHIRKQEADLPVTFDGIDAPKLDVYVQTNWKRNVRT